MNIYSIYVKSQENDSDPVIIKQGFSFIAGLLNVFWAAYYKLWFPVIVGLLANLSLGLAQNDPRFMNIAYAINFAILFVFGFFGNDMREYYAEKRGYILKDLISAGSEEEAEIKFMSRLSQENTILNQSL